MSVNFGNELRHRTSLHQGRANRVAHEIVDHALLPETDLGFRRMYVDVNLFIRHLQKQQHHRVDGGRHNVAIRFGDGVLHTAIANQTPVHEDVNRVAVELLDFWLRNKAMYANFARHAGWLVLLHAAPGRRLRQTDALQMLKCRNREKLVKNLFSENLIKALAMP